MIVVPTEHVVAALNGDTGPLAGWAHFADGHAKSCSPACIVEIESIKAALNRVIEASLKSSESSRAERLMCWLDRKRQGLIR